MSRREVVLVVAAHIIKGRHGRALIVAGRHADALGVSVSDLWHEGVLAAAVLGGGCNE